MGKLRELANSPLPTPQPCDEAHFVKCLALMDILPRRNDDTLTGRARIALMRRHLGGFSSEAISYLAQTATARCHWFPTPAECLEILRDWPNRDRDGALRQKARHLIQRELNHRMDETVARLAERALDQNEIDALPEMPKRIASEKGYLWAWPDGRFTVRRDRSVMSPEDAEAEGKRVAAMLAEWDRIRAEQAGITGEAQ